MLRSAHTFEGSRTIKHNRAASLAAVARAYTGLRWRLRLVPPLVGRAGHDSRSATAGGRLIAFKAPKICVGRWREGTLSLVMATAGSAMPMAVPVAAVPVLCRGTRTSDCSACL